MGMFDEPKEQPLGSHGSNSAGGTDVLYGWLVGRAAADLGLAQALAASEAQRKGQIKRLEDNLLSQMRELRDAQMVNTGAAANPAELDALKTEIERVSELQQQLAAEQINVEGLEAAISAKLREFEEQIQKQTQNSPSGVLGDVKLELNMLADRVARAEFSTQQAHAQAPIESQRIEELVNQSMRNEMAGLKAALLDEISESPLAENFSHQVDEKLQSKIDELRGEIAQGAHASNELTELGDRYSRLEQTALQAAADLKAEISAIKTRLSAPANQRQSDELLIKGVEAALGKQMVDLQEQLGAVLGAVDQRNAEVGALNQQLTTLSEKVAALSSRAEGATARQAAQSEWVEEIEKLISARLRDGENRLSVKLAQLEKSDGSLGQFQLELNALLNRVAQMELTHQQPATQWVQGIEESLSGKIQELRDYLAREQQDRHGRDAILNELRGEMQIVVQRLVQAEANAQQSHALMVNDAAQAAQLRDQMIGELSALQGQLNQRQERDAMFEVLGAELRGRIYEEQNLLSQKLAVLESRDAEFAELKSQVHELTQLSTQKSAVTPTAASRPPSPIAVNVGLGGLKMPAEAIPALTPMASVSESIRVMPSHQTPADGLKDETKQLQQRLSADIERARAELRKRAGVGR